MRYVLTICILFACLITKAQQEPQIFEAGLVSNGGEFGFTLSPDQREAFWVRSNGGRDTLVILHSKNVKGKWSTPVPASFSGRPGLWKDIDPVFSPDGKMILFQSNRPVKNRPGREGFDIWAVRKTSKGWSDAYHLGNEINSDDSESFASITRSGNIYFMKQNPDDVGSSDIYMSRFDQGRYEEPVNLGMPINTSFRESNPYISPDEDYLIYFSSDSAGYGDVDLFISFRKEGQWTAPKNLGKGINSSIGEFCPFVHERQGKLYFSRTTEVRPNRREENIYSVDFRIEDYRDAPE